MSADMWRVPASVVRKGSLKSVIQDNGMLRHAVTASNGYFLFSEVGAGVQPLALIGLWHEVLNYMAQRGSSGIDNRIEELPEIYMGISFYRPGQRFVGLFPVHDFVQQVVEKGAGFVPGSTVTDIGGAIGDTYSLGKTIFGKKKKPKAPSLGSNELYIKFSYLQEKGMASVGHGKVQFSALYPVLLNSLSAMSPISA